MRIVSLFILSLVILSACSTDDGQLPTQLELPAPTKTLIPTQSQQLAPPTLPDVGNQSAESQVTQASATQSPSTNSATTTDTIDNDTTSPAPTDTPIDCNVQDDWETYIIQRGDNLVGIANRTGSTVDELTAANCLENPNRVRAGQELYVPNLPVTPTLVPTAMPTAGSTNTAPVTLQSSTVQSIVAPTSVPTITSSQPNVTQPSVSVSINKTFESEIGFGLKFPADWFISESTTSTVENAFITSFEYTLGDEIPQNLWTDDMVSITITIFQETTDESLQEWTQTVARQFQNANNIAEVFTPVTFRTDAEIEGQSLDYITTDETVVRNYYFIINNHKVQLNIGGNLDLAVPVINSLET